MCSLQRLIGDEVLGPMSTNDPQNSQSLSKIQTGLLPLEGVCAGQAKEVGRDSIVDTEVCIVEVAGASRLCCNLVALLNKADGAGEQAFCLGGLEMQSRSSREGSNQHTNH